MPKGHNSRFRLRKVYAFRDEQRNAETMPSQAANDYSRD